MSNHKRPSLCLFILLVTLCLTATSFAQDSPPKAQPSLVTPNSRPNIDNASEIVQAGMVNGCANLLRAFIDAKAHIVSLETENDKANRVNIELQNKINTLEQQKEEALAEAQHFKNALALSEKNAATYKQRAENAEARVTKLEKQVKFWRKIGLVFGTAVAVFVFK